MFTIRECSNISGISESTLQKWVQTGRISCRERGSLGRGNATRFDVPQAIALCVIGRLRRARLGCGPSKVSSVFWGICRAPQSFWEDNFSQDPPRVYFASVTRPSPGNPVLPVLLTEEENNSFYSGILPNILGIRKKVDAFLKPLRTAARQ